MKDVKKVAFFGAGRYAQKNIGNWKNEWNVVCFVDNDEKKWDREIGGVRIRSLEYLEKNYPDIDIVITTDSRFSDIYNDLLDYGIDEKHISFIIPREKRLGCKLLGKCIQFEGGKYIKTCCYERAYVQTLHDNIGAEYDKFHYEVMEIINGLKSGALTTCNGCSMLVEDWWEINPRVEMISLASGFKDDVCNCRCIYCDASRLLESVENSKYSVFDACSFFGSDKRFDNASIIINDGEFTLNKHQKELLNICQKKRWPVTLYTNGTHISKEVLSFMKKCDTTIVCSLDAGTRETFKKIKGVDLFDKTVENLKKYSENGYIVLKYILLRDINDTEKDVDYFIKLACNLADKVVLSRDINMRKELLTIKERKIFCSFVEKLYNDKNIPIEFSEDCMPTSEVPWIRSLL